MKRVAPLAFPTSRMAFFSRRNQAWMSKGDSR
jgi:hypothetical protein